MGASESGNGYRRERIPEVETARLKAHKAAEARQSGGERESHGDEW
jgi:hypothetical protein